METCYFCIHRNAFSYFSLRLKTNRLHTPKYFRMAVLFTFPLNKLQLWNTHVIWCSYLYSYPDEQMEKWSVLFSVVTASLTIIIWLLFLAQATNSKRKWLYLDVEIRLWGTKPCNTTCICWMYCIEVNGIVPLCIK